MEQVPRQSRYYWDPGEGYPRAVILTVALRGYCVSVWLYRQFSPLQFLFLENCILLLGKSSNCPVNGTSLNGGSALSRNNSVPPPISLIEPCEVLRKILSPLGSKISSSRHPSASIKTWIPASSAVAFTSNLSRKSLTLTTVVGSSSSFLSSLFLSFANTELLAQKHTARTMANVRKNRNSREG